MDWFASQRSHFWKGQPFKDFQEFQQVILAKEVDNQTYYWIQFPKPYSLATPNESWMQFKVSRDIPGLINILLILNSILIFIRI